MKINLNIDQVATLIVLLNSKIEKLEEDIDFLEEQGCKNACNCLRKELNTIKQLKDIFIKCH